MDAGRKAWASASRTPTESEGGTIVSPSKPKEWEDHLQGVVNEITTRWAHQVAEMVQVGQFLVAPTLEEVNSIRRRYSLTPLTMRDV